MALPTLAAAVAVVVVIVVEHNKLAVPAVQVS